MATGGGTATSVPQGLDIATVRFRLRTCYRQLIKQLLPHMVCPYLVQNRVLDFDEADMVLDERGMTNQAARIIALVARKGDQVLERFVTSLRQSNHEHLANVLVMPKEAEHNDDEEIPMSVDFPEDAPRAWGGDSSVIDIRISLGPGPHGQVATSHQSFGTAHSPASACGQPVSAPSPSVAAPHTPGTSNSALSFVQPIPTPISAGSMPGGQPPSSTESHGGCPSPGCRCGYLQQSLLHTLYAAQQTLEGLYPLRSEQDVQMSAECRMTISQCLETLQWLANGGVHVHQVLQACVLLRATCQDVEALDRLLEWLIDGTLRQKLEMAYQLGDEPQFPLPFTVKLNPIQYLLYRERLDLSSKGLNEFRSQYSEAFLRRMGDDIDSQYYLQLVQCLLAKNRLRHEADSAKVLWQKSSDETMVLLRDLSVKEPEPAASPWGFVSSLFQTIAAGTFVSSLTGAAAGAAAAAIGFTGPPETPKSSEEKLNLLLQTISRHVELTQSLLHLLCGYRYTAYVFAKLMFSFTELHGIILQKDMSLKQFGNYILRLVRCYPVPCEETFTMDQYVRWLSRDPAPRVQLLRENARPLEMESSVGVVSESCHSLQDVLDAATTYRELSTHYYPLLSQNVEWIRDTMPNMVADSGLYDTVPVPSFSKKEML